VCETTNPNQSIRWQSRRARETPCLWPDKSHRETRSLAAFDHPQRSPCELAPCENLAVATNLGPVCLDLKCKRVLRSGPANRVSCFAVFPAATWPSRRRGPMGGRRRGNWQRVLVARLFLACLGTEAFSLRSQPSASDPGRCRKECRLPQLTRSSRRKSRV